MQQIPGWLSTALIGAVIAALGYVSKLAIESALQWRAARTARRAQLVHLLSLLLATRKAFIIQNALARRLCDEITRAHPELDGSYDNVLAHGYPSLDDRQKLEHGVIRNYTSNCLYPLNLQIIDWLSKDDYFKGGGRQQQAKELSVRLQTLFAHLVLWRAKYEFWIPSRPERAIVYMADEDAHGISFPTGIEDLISRVADDMIGSPGEAASWEGPVRSSTASAGE
ncbi:hypothetical protein [Bradyrhizobium japonicum]|uniref:hypothetical protein n=1 Tax=Bradyrhizobium japonicum TaxID=375 RepID=UPI001BA78312|nr:hypothetical protein [Bradyrhizobium japonicum]MBR0908607.1 hypothetical protein [Bradyrhizobium japonicum]